MSWEFVLIGLGSFAVIAAGMVGFFYYRDPHRFSRRRPDRFDPADKDLPEMERRRTPNEPPRKRPKGTP